MSSATLATRNRATIHRAVLAATLVGTLLTACSSESKSDPGGTTSGGTKTCADLTKCCDKLAEPQKSACSAAAGAKVESACASSYDKVCNVADGGAEAGPDASAAADTCKSQNEVCTDTASCCDGLRCQVIGDAVSACQP